ncbi:unnamed protein product [Moneuplotes crassus]|uniref:Uncharacterized protein n=1 Tax=Euplotes crassus TaxID=5936 RepID=A0AAD2D9V6_EUPCR|nr:unnamed protein product [Moneuplotes crassus]
MRSYFSQPETYTNISIEALKTQLAVNLLLQNQAQLSSILGNMHSTNVMMNPSSLNHVSSILNMVNTSKTPQVINRPIPTFGNENILMNQAGSYVPGIFENPGFINSKVLPLPSNFGITAVEKSSPVKASSEPLKKIDETRKSSLSIDQTVADLDTKAGESSEPCGETKPTSLVFNIRRYNKKQKKFILLTRHRKLITKCEHTDEEYYAKGMCKKCYHNKGERSKYATTCGHTDKFHYAKGLCKGCYLTEYHKGRKPKPSA